MSEAYIYGFHAVAKRLQQAPGSCIELLCEDKRNSRLQNIIEQAKKAGVVVRYEKRELLARLGESDKHQGCVLKISETGDATMDFAQCLNNIGPETLLLILDGVQDPHNLGACLRSADACAVDAVIIPRDRAVKMNATVRKVAAGGAESVPLIEVTNLARSLRDLQQAGVWIYGSSGEADHSLYEFDFSGPVALVMGAEGSGLRRLTMDVCDHLVKLPMRGKVESLNVSVASGVCLYEILRSRNALKQQ
jgi:23S rRNA (guanosine2251-2'-O)-methyltransferase